MLYYFFLYIYNTFGLKVSFYFLTILYLGVGIYAVYFFRKKRKV